MDKSEFSLLPFISKKCSICEKEFKTNRSYQNICSWQCRQEANKQRCRATMRRLRHKTDKHNPCEICGYKEVTDIHHEGNEVYRLCPNHHALITRGIKTATDLFIELHERIQSLKV